MKRISIIIYCLCLLVSCKKWKYEEVRIHGKVINGCLGVPMSGEQVELVEVKDEFLGSGSKKVLKTATTNSNGEYDFGGVDLRKKDKFKYYVNYIHRGLSVLGFCDSYEVDKNSIDQNKDLVIFIGGGLQFKINPNMSAMGPADQIKIIVKNSVNYSRFYCNPNAENDNMERLSDTIMKDEFFSDGLSKLSDPIGNAYYYIKIEKIKSSILFIEEDTVYINSDYIYQINW